MEERGKCQRKLRASKTTWLPRIMHARSQKTIEIRAVTSRCNGGIINIITIIIIIIIQKGSQPIQQCWFTRGRSNYKGPCIVLQCQNIVSHVGDCHAIDTESRANLILSEAPADIDLDRVAFKASSCSNLFNPIHFPTCVSIL